jgi:hypothetical protein
MGCSPHLTSPQFFIYLKLRRPGVWRLCGTIVLTLGAIAVKSPIPGTSKVHKREVRFGTNFIEEQRKAKEREMLKILAENIKSKPRPFRQT